MGHKRSGEKGWMAPGWSCVIRGLGHPLWMNSLEMGRENEHRWSIVQEIHDEPVSKSLAEMGERSSGLTPYTLAGERNALREPWRP